MAEVVNVPLGGPWEPRAARRRRRVAPASLLSTVAAAGVLRAPLPAAAKAFPAPRSDAAVVRVEGWHNGWHPGPFWGGGHVWHGARPWYGSPGWHGGLHGGPWHGGLGWHPGHDSFGWAGPPSPWLHSPLGPWVGGWGGPPGIGFYFSW